MAGAAFLCGGCGGGGDDNELGRATVDGEVMGQSIDANAIAWHATVAGTSLSLIAIHEAGIACDADISAGNTLALLFECPLEAGSYSVAAGGDGACPDQISVVFEDSGADIASGSGGSITLEPGDNSLLGSFDIDFGDERLGGSFNLRDCGEISLPE